MFFKEILLRIFSVDKGKSIGRTVMSVMGSLKEAPALERRRQLQALQPRERLTSPLITMITNLILVNFIIYFGQI
jgi:hypothetical protein